MEVEHKAYWALKQCNTDLAASGKNRYMQLNELAELRDGAYENTKIHKELTKKWHDSRLCDEKDFKVGDNVLLFNYRFRIHPRKLKSKWYGPNVGFIGLGNKWKAHKAQPYGWPKEVIKEGIRFKDSHRRGEGHRLSLPITLQRRQKFLCTYTTHKDETSSTRAQIGEESFKEFQDLEVS
nr:hypothetical protein [Tanacetum cinerariifolium]